MTSTSMRVGKSVLGRVRNCVGEQALHCVMMWWRHPTCASLTIAMQNPCFVYTVWGAKCVKNTYKCYICISPSDI